MAKDMTLDLSPLEANALLIMLNESLEMHFNGYGDSADWEFFDLDAARLTAYHRFRTVYEEQFPNKEK
jgi:hypothetical protein